jgi:hypothetical protein
MVAGINPMSAPDDHAPPVSARVAMRDGWPALLINDEPVLPHIYGLTDCPGGRFTWEEFPARNIRLFAECGVRLFQVMLWEEWIFAEDGTINLEMARRQVRGVLDQCPDALVSFRYHLNTTREWNEANPDECVRFADAGYHPPIRFFRHRPVDDDEKNSLRVSLASRVWKERSGDRLRRFCELFAGTPEGGRVFGIQVACGVFGEWHQWGFLRHEPDVSPAMLGFFRGELRRKYGTDADLQAAWGDESVTFETAGFPTLAERMRRDDGMFRDPARQRRTIDYYDALQAAAPEAILHFCRVIREAWPRPVVTGAFHGYFKFLFGRAALGGHTHVARLLRAPEIDCLCAPQSYTGFCRHIGGTGESRGFPGACRRAGKLWLDEMDQNTHLGSILVPPVAKTAEQDAAIMRRNMFYSYAHGQGAWYFDFGPSNFTGAWDHPRLMDEAREITARLTRGYSARAFKRHADVLLVFDTRVFWHTVPDWRIDSVGEAACDELPNAWMRSGALVEEAYLDELAEMDLTPFRLVVFANCFVLDHGRKRVISERVCRDGRHVLWTYLPGYSDDRTLDAAHVEALTGFRLQLREPTVEPSLRIERGGFGPAAQWLRVRARPLVFEGDSIDLQTSVRTPESAATWAPIPFPEIIDEPGIDVHGYYEGRLTSAFASRAMDGWTSWFSALPLRQPGVLRGIARRAGCRIVSEADDALAEGGGWLCVHTADGGPRTLNLPDGTVRHLHLGPAQTAWIPLKESGESGVYP